MLTRQQQRRQLQLFKAVFQNNPNKPVGLLECLHSGFYWSKDDGGGGDTWSCKTSKAKLHRQQTNIRILHAWCPSCRPTNSVRPLKGEIITLHGLARPQAHLGSSVLFFTTEGSWLLGLSSALWRQYPILFKYREFELARLSIKNI